MRLLLLRSLILLGAAPLEAQVSLADALRRADTSGVANRVAAGVRVEREGAALAPLRGILPAIRTEVSAIRTTDPIGVFGTTLRQRRISATDFNPITLNNPVAATNIGAGLVAELPLFNADAWLGRAAARDAAGASHSAAGWTQVRTRVDVIGAYYGALLAAERVETLAAAARAATAHVKQAESLQRNGVVTPSDALLASVRTGELNADLASARGDVVTAQRGLALLLGDDAQRQIAPAGALPTAAQLRAFASADTAPAALRTDVQAATLGASAAARDADRARVTLLPRLNGFARYDWNDPSQLFGGTKNWTVGMMASWSPFTGAAELSEQRATRGRAQSAAAMAAGATAQARFEVDKAETELRVALLRLEIAEQGVSQATDAHRIVTRRYDGGLASISEVLDAAAAESRTHTMLAKARYDVITVLAARRLARGLDPAALAALDASTALNNTPKDSDR